ncbi:hypothetical protein PQX77_011905 [Marasmius sp. AFHP31]|nr:hypothetical protein PQX77_011905 [Marasmius sp. AFHP31]
MLATFFQKAQNCKVAGCNFNQVQGDQYNYTTTIVQAKGEESTDFDGYYEVKLGAIYKLGDVGCAKYPRQWDDGEPRADRTICTARVLGRPGMAFTVVQYSGPQARRAFEEDFRMLSGILTSNGAQIYGYSKSKIPLLVLYNELVPATCLDIRGLGSFYLGSLAIQLGCKDQELWLDTGRGVFCRGPSGADDRGYLAGFWWFGWEASYLPSTVEFLQEDVLVRFLASLESKPIDRVIIWELARQFQTVPDTERVSQPTVFSSTNTPITVADGVWQNSCNSLVNRNLLENGLTRFTLAGDHPFDPYVVWNGSVSDAWLSQASSIFHAHGIALEDDLSVYNLVYRSAMLRLPNRHLPEAQSKQRPLPIDHSPIYLFLRPPPSDLSDSETSSLHYWSFDENGHAPLSRHVCHDLGLPVELQAYNYDYKSYSWSSVAYKHIQEYQALRGFDPSTTDFTRHLGYGHLIFRPVHSSDWLEFLQEPQPASSPSAMVASDAQEIIEGHASAHSPPSFVVSETRHGAPASGLPFSFNPSQEFAVTK